MKWAGFLLLLSGWLLLLIAPVILSSTWLRFVFVVAGLLVERYHRALAGGQT